MYLDNSEIPDNQSLAPKYYQVSQNYPNPFNGETIIKYSIPQKEHMSINVYDTAGNFIENLYEGIKNTGNYNLKWNPKNYASGVYLVRLKAGNGFEKTIKTLLLK